VRTGRGEIAEAIERGGGVITVRDHPHLERLLQRTAAAGELVAVLPGVYVWRERATDLDVRIRAAARWCPDGVLTGPAAARLAFWPEVRFAEVTLSTSRKRAGRPGFRVTREALPPELVVQVGGLRCTRAALTALDLVDTHGGAGIDRALLTRACTLADLHEALALTPSRRGNRARREMLHDSRDEPWSEAERLAHALLRAAGITGWKANLAVRCGERRYYLDVGFAACRVAVEIDGYEVHSRRPQFHRDRQKWSDLTAAGWRVLHFTYDQLRDEPAWVIDTLRSALAWQA
jgi:very-short-patch-repair endonuclease